MASADLAAKLDPQTMHQTVRWFHIDGEHTGTAVYRELEFANRIVNTEGIVVIDDFFSPRYPANTTEVIRYLEKNPFHFRLLAVGFNKGYLCRPESLPRYMDFMASGMSRALQGYGAKTTIFKTTGPWDTDAVGMSLIDGPFSNLSGMWRFTPVGDGSQRACKVELDLQYGFSSKTLAALVGPVFDKIAASLVDAFVKRAETVYG